MKKSKLQKNSYFWSSFEKIFEALPDILPQPQKMKFDTLDKNMFDSEIIKKYNIEPLPLPQLCSNIQQLIDNDTIRTDGLSDIFYGKAEDGRILVLYVYRRDGRWDWFCYELDGDGLWNAGRRIFSLATVADLDTKHSDTQSLDNLDTFKFSVINKETGNSIAHFMHGEDANKFLKVVNNYEIKERK